MHVVTPTATANNATYSTDISSPHMRGGIKIEPGMSPTDIMHAASLDWTVEKHPIYSDGALIPGKFNLKRADTGQHFAFVSDAWEPPQNAQTFEMFEQLCDKGGYTMEAAGIKSGQHVWAVARTKSAVTVGNGDRIEGLIALSNPHDYGKAVTITPIGDRLFCANQMIVGDKHATARYAHTGGNQFDATRAADFLTGSVSAGLTKFANLAEYLISKQISAKRLVEYITRVYDMTAPDPTDITPQAEAKRDRHASKVKALLVEAHTMRGADHGAGTYWQALNLVTHHADHVQNRSNPDAAYHSSTFGGNSRRKAKASRLALTMAKQD